MGDIVDSILDGIFCEVCGFYLGDINKELYGCINPGFPVKCENCKEKKK